ncbi:MAG TPA: hypothetical protein VGF48_06020 [Thermoanaerobaculia bacterium]|jgi:hypothetical protein
MNRIVQWKEREVSVRVVDGDSQECEGSYAFVYAGHGVTDETGAQQIDLRKINCDPPGPRHNSLPSIVATPTFNGLLDRVWPPVILTATAVPGGFITISSFDLSGKPAPRIPFSWHAVVEGELV